MSERSGAKAQDAVHDAAPAYRMVLPDEVPSGYKRTEVGVIPEDWGIKTLSHFISDLQAGVSVNSITSDLAGDVPCVLKTSCIQAGAFFPTEAKAISPKDRTRVGVAPKAGAILISRMNTIDLVGESGFVCADYENLFLPDRIWMTVFNRHVRFSSRWLAFVLSSPAYRRHLKEIATGTSGSMKNIAKRSLLQLAVPQPSESEQRAIATALSDADALIESLDRLIAKKRAIKQAAMQQLLTGQTRLPGFTGEWETKRLGDISHIKTGDRNNQDKAKDGLYPFFVRSEFVERINSYSYDCEAIVVPGEGRIGDIFHYVNGRFDVHQRVYAITQFHPWVSPKFVYYYMVHKFGNWAMRNTVKATVDSLRLPTFKTFELLLPPTEDEQTAIATVLSDMDGDIEVLERRRGKARQFKQGMMQQLLTGRVRLVKPEYAA